MGSVIETGVICILFVFHAVTIGLFVFYQDLYGNESFERKKKKTEMDPISLKGAQIYCEDHSDKTTERNVRKKGEGRGGEGAGVQRD